MVDGDSVVDVSEYSAALRRWWYLVAVAALVGAVVGAAAIQLQSGAYVSQARVEVRPLVIQGDDPNLDINRQVDISTERVIANSQRVAERALALLEVAGDLGRLDDPEVEAAAEEVEIDPELARAVTEDVDVSIPNDTQILVFTASAENASEAQQLAQSMAHAYLDFRQEEGLASTEAARTQLLEREAALLAELDELAAASAAASNEAERQALSYQDISKREELAGIGTRLASVSAISVNVGEVLDDADLPSGRSGLPTLVGPIGGLMLGAFAGIAAAFLLDRADDRFRNTAGELASMGLRPLGTVPLRGGWSSLGPGATLVESHGDAGEAYRRVQGSLLFALDESDKSMVLVAGTNNPQTSTAVAANLAAAAARAGRRTLIIGADLRHPRLHARFGLTNDQGLSDVLSGACSFNAALQSLPELPNLSVLSAGTPVEQPARVLQSVGLGRLVAHVRDTYDLVVFEAPPVLQVADSVDLARLSEGALLVVEPGRSDRTDVADAVEQLRRVGAELVGTVVVESIPEE